MDGPLGLDGLHVMKIVIELARGTAITLATSSLVGEMWMGTEWKFKEWNVRRLYVQVSKGQINFFIVCGLDNSLSRQRNDDRFLYNTFCFYETNLFILNSSCFPYFPRPVGVKAVWIVRTLHGGQIRVGHDTRMVFLDVFHNILKL